MSVFPAASKKHLPPTWQTLMYDPVSTCHLIIMYIYHALINALSAHMIHINLNMIFYTHVKHSPTKTIYIKYYLKKKMSFVMFVLNNQ